VINVKNKKQNFGFEIVTGVTLKRTVFWVVTPYSSERVQLFGATYRLDIQD
jgi:hypothetical protein